MSVPTASLRDDRVLPETRIVAAIVIPVLLLAFVILYLSPDTTDQHFSWTIKPTMTPIAMGAGYLMGAYFFFRALTTSRWHRVAAGFLPITTFTLFMAIATVLHWDRFHHGTLAATLWIILYAVTPLLVPFLWYRNRARAVDSPESDDVAISQILSFIALAFGVTVSLAGVVILIFPDLAIQTWPWQLTPLTARVVAGWLMLAGVGGLVLSREKRWSGWRVLVESAIIGGVLLIIGVVRAWGDWNSSNPISIVIAIGVGITFLLAPFLWIYEELQRRQATQSLAQ